MIRFEPYNQEAEEAFIGAFFLDGDLVKECTVKPDQLYSSKLKVIYTAIRKLDENGKPIDLISVVEELGTDQLVGIGGVSFITDLASSVPTTANFHFYEQLVKEYDQKRKAIHIAQKIIKQAGENEIGETISTAIQHLMDIEGEQTDKETGDIAPVLVDLFLDCEKDHGDLVGIPSGFSHLDKLTGGFQESDLVIIGARPSMGKTAFALNLALQAAIQDVSLIFSLEMSKKQLLKRVASFTGNIDSLKMKNPQRDFEEEDWHKFSETIGWLSKVNLHIFDRAGMDIPYIWLKVRKARREYGTQKRMLVVIDYLQLIEGHTKNKQFPS